MKRREFLSAAAAAAFVSACGSERDGFARGGPDRGTTADLVPAFELEELTLGNLADGLRSGRWSSAGLTELYLDRIRLLNRAGPMLGAVIETNPDAPMIAAQLDRARREGGSASGLFGPLHGIPILIKDNIDTADRMSTSAGSLALEHSHAAKDSDVAARLRAAGAVILGKTNLSEWANYRSLHSISGWSGRGGFTRNPYVLDRNPSGSSSGSAAAAAANLCAAAVGSETDGSIVSPASINGLVGVKPTVGLIGGAGIIPISHSQDTAGPITRTVRDAAILLTALADPKARAPQDFAKSLDGNGLKRARLGVARKFFENNSPMNRFLDGCVDTLKRAGAEVIDPADMPSHGKWGEPENEVLLYEFKSDLNAYLAKLSHGNAGELPRRTLADLIAFNEKNRAREMPYFGQEIWLQAEAKSPLTDAAYIKARADSVRLARTEGIDAVMQAQRLDAIVCLTGGPAWLIDPVNGDMDTGSCSTPAAVAGYPHVTVPAGFYGELPMGLSFFGSAWSEARLLKLAYAWEQLTQARRKPKFLQTIAAV